MMSAADPLAVPTLKVSRSVKGRTVFWGDVQRQYRAGQFCDLQLRFEGCNKVLSCHRMVLASVSAVVRDALLTADGEEMATISVPGAAFEHVKGLVDFLYAFLAAGQTPAGYVLQLSAFQTLGIEVGQLGQVSQTPRTISGPCSNQDVKQETAERSGPSVSRKRKLESVTISAADMRVTALFLQPKVRLERITAGLPRPGASKTAMLAAKRRRLAKKFALPKNPTPNCSERVMEALRKPELCRQIVERLQTGQGSLQIDMKKEPMRYMKAYFDWSPYKLQNVALIGLSKTNDAYKAIPLAWPLGADEDPYEQFKQTGEAFKAVLGFSSNDTFYKTFYLKKLGQTSRNVQGQLRNKLRKDLARLSDEDLNGLKEEATELLRRKPPKPRNEVIRGQISVNLDKTVPIEEIQNIVMIFLLDTGEVKGRLCILCDDDLSKESGQMAWMMLHVWCDLASHREPTLKSGRQGVLAWSPITPPKLKSPKMVEMIYEVMRPVETYKVAESFLQNPDEKEAVLSKSVQCSTCGKTFPLTTVYEEREYSLHQRHHYFQDFPCDCGLEFTTFNEKKWHVMLHHSTGRKYKKCDICPFVSNASRVKVHMKLHARGAEVNELGEYPCKDCNMVFQSKSGASLHFSKYHQSISCFECAEKFQGKRSLVEHFKVSHPDKADELVGKWNLSGNSSALCSQCGKDVMNLSQHVETMHAEQTCQHCQRVFQGTRKLFNHCAAEHPETCEKHICSQCGKFFYRKESLETHTKRQHPSDETNRFACDLCQRKFAFKSELDAHRNTMHLKLPIHQCRVDGCDLRFYDPAARYHHEKKEHNRFQQKTRQKLSA